MQNTGNWRNINMSKYLLEIGVEELPYKFIPMAISQLEAGFKSFLESNNVGYENIKVMATPRRLAVIISGLANSQPDVEKVVKGPIATVAYDENKNLTPAGLGFAKKNGVVVIFDIDYRPYNWKNADEIAIYYSVVASNSANTKIVAYFYNFSDPSVGQTVNSKNGGTNTGTFGNLTPNAKYNYLWFDPINNKVTQEGTFTADANGKWSAGAKKNTDMVLYIYK